MADDVRVLPADVAGLIARLRDRAKFWYSIDMYGLERLLREAADALERLSIPLSANIAEIEQGMNGGWKPIETAPRDGSRFLAWCRLTYDEFDENDRFFTRIKKGNVEEYAVVAYFVFGSFVEFPWQGSFVQNMQFTDWQPLPAGPR